MKPKDTVAIGWCHAGQVDTEFALSIIEIVRQKGKKINAFYCVEGLGLLAKSRNIMIKHFLENTDADWLLMLDADERISVPAFDLLCATADSVERPIVAGLYFAALWNGPSLRPVPLIFKADQELGLQPWDSYPPNEVVEIAAAGTGCLLMHRSALKKIQDSSDEGIKDWCWFQDGPIGGNKWLSEDLTFCSKLSQAGIPIHAHTGAILQHHKQIWVDEPHFKAWLEHNESGSGLDQLR
jgi:hypothetical protein